MQLLKVRRRKVSKKSTNPVLKDPKENAPEAIEKTVKKKRKKRRSKSFKASGLTVLQTRFCLKYVELGNGTQAYKDAGYKTTGKGATVNASRLLTNDSIKAYINILMQEIIEKGTADAAEVIVFLSSVMRGEIEDQYADLPSVKDRVDAGKTLAKIFGMAQPEKITVSGTIEHKGPSVADELIRGMFTAAEEPEEDPTKVN